MAQVNVEMAVRSTMLGLRLLIAGVLLTVLGLALRWEKDMADAGWRLVIAGPLAVAGGLFILIRSRSASPPPERDT